MNLISMMSCSLDDALTAWNEGFADYSVEVRMNVEQFIKTMASKRLSPQYSFIAYEDGKPVGIILNSIQPIDGKWMAYNGGTAVHPEYRKKGVGHQLVHASLDLFKKERVEIGTLEAISDNHQAIHLYESHGYQVDDRLATLRKVFTGEAANSPYTLVSYSLSEWRKISFQEQPVPWQNKIPFISEREIYVLLKGQIPYGYLILTRPAEKNVTIYQLQALEDNVPYQDLLQCVSESFTGYEATAFNVPYRHPAYKAYQAAGFQEVIEQVWMTKAFPKNMV